MKLIELMDGAHCWLNGMEGPRAQAEAKQQTQFLFNSINFFDWMKGNEWVAERCFSSSLLLFISSFSLHQMNWRVKFIWLNERREVELFFASGGSYGRWPSNAKRIDFIENISIPSTFLVHSTFNEEKKRIALLISCLMREEREWKEVVWWAALAVNLITNHSVIKENFNFLYGGGSAPRATKRPFHSPKQKVNFSFLIRESWLSELKKYYNSNLTSV